MEHTLRPGCCADLHDDRLNALDDSVLCEHLAASCDEAVGEDHAAREVLGDDLDCVVVSLGGGFARCRLCVLGKVVGDVDDAVAEFRLVEHRCGVGGDLEW